MKTGDREIKGYCDELKSADNGKACLSRKLETRETIQGMNPAHPMSLILLGLELGLTSP